MADAPKPTAEQEAERRAALALSTPTNMTGTHGLNELQLQHVRHAAQKFKTGWFTIGMFCDATKMQAVDCTKVFAELHAAGAIRKPVNDGGGEYYQVIPEMALRTIMSGRMPQL